MRTDTDGVAEDDRGVAEADGLASWSVAATTGPLLDRESEIEVRFAVLEARYGEMLRRFLLGLSRRPEVAEDLVQQLWLKRLEAARAGTAPQDRRRCELRAGEFVAEAHPHAAELRQLDPHGLATRAHAVALDLDADGAQLHEPGGDLR